jgi:methionyl-tRNA formyltransferase
MNQISETIVFFGNERLATGLGTSAPTLRALIRAGYNVAAVVVAQHEMSKSRKTRPLEVAQVASEHTIPVLSPERLLDAVDELKSYGAGAAVLAAYGKIVPKQILDLFPLGIVNIHPSLLPLHRGSTPIESTILNGESETGVSLMKLIPEMDAGPVYVQATVQLTGHETKQALTDQLSQMGTDLLLANLPAILNGSLQPTEQDHDRVTTDQMISKADSQLDWQKPAEVLAREVRAFKGWPRSRCQLGTQGVIVTEAHAAMGTNVPGTIWLADKQLGMNCSEGILIIDKLIPLGKKEMTAHDFLLGYKPA